jgi:hypothetical protein
MIVSATVYAVAERRVYLSDVYDCTARTRRRVADMGVLLTQNGSELPFRVGDPITCCGEGSVQSGVWQMTGAHSPHGYIRYNGRVYHAL